MTKILTGERRSSLTNSAAEAGAAAQQQEVVTMKPESDTQLQEDDVEDLPAAEDNQAVSSDDSRNDRAASLTPGREQERAAPPTSREEARVLDERGDVDFIVTCRGEINPYPSRYKASSACIRLASPKWSSLLDNAVAAPSTGSKTIEIEEAHSGVIEFVLAACHMQHHWIPIHMTFDGLVQVAEVCQRHSVTMALQPYLKGWAYPWLSKLFRPGFEMWILVAYEFWYSDIFYRVSEQLAMDMERSDTGHLIVPGGKNLSTAGLPEPIIANLVRLRTAYLEHIIETCYRYIEHLSTSKPDSCDDRRSQKTAATNLGFFLRGLREHGIWPVRPTADDIRISVNKFREQLSEIKMYAEPDDSMKIGQFNKHDFLVEIGNGRLSTATCTVEKSSLCCQQLERGWHPYWSDLLPWEYEAICGTDFRHRDFESLPWQPAGDTKPNPVEGDNDPVDKEHENGVEGKKPGDERTNPVDVSGVDGGGAREVEEEAEEEDDDEAEEEEDDDDEAEEEEEEEEKEEDDAEEEMGNRRMTLDPDSDSDADYDTDDFDEDEDMGEPPEEWESEVDEEMSGGV
ncbi:hypothetical protein GGR56DRAFT_164551 [Xylariaceae sp. FL0804]|nr:hypothetical protein GGR56DRAFT_164551 [Xylariaceae sp. FL0804]